MASYDLGLFKGHGLGDVGAVGNGFQEHERVSTLADKIAKHLTGKGLKVHTGVNNYVNVYVNSNTYGKKFALSLHLNSASDSSASGCEILVPLKEKYFDLEIEILKGLEGLGFKNRGLKSRDYNTEAWSLRTNGQVSSGTDYYKEIRTAWAKGVSLSIVEFCFISNSADIQRFNNNIDKIALLVANAILRMLKIDLIPEPKPTTTKETYFRVMCGSFKERANAEKLLVDLKNKGFNGSIMIFEK